MSGIAVGIGALMLGGWILNSSPENPIEETSPAPATLSRETTPASSASGTTSTSGGTESFDAQQQSALRYRAMQNLQKNQKAPTAAQPGTQTGGQVVAPPVAAPAQGQPTNQPYQPGMNPAAGRPGPNANIPVTPTEPVRSKTLDALGMPSAPTGNSSDSLVDARTEDANLSRGPGGSVMPMVPTSRQAYSPRTYSTPSSYNEMDYRRMLSQTSVHPGFTQPQAVEKPLATVQPFTNGVSPWMNLYRNDRSGGVVNNYYTLVRPALDQRSMNQQFHVDLYGLERSNRIQNAAMQQMNLMNQRMLQSVGTPQFQMNYGNYYPNYGQPNQPLGR